MVSQLCIYALGVMRLHSNLEVRAWRYSNIRDLLKMANVIRSRISCRYRAYALRLLRCNEENTQARFQASRFRCFVRPSRGCVHWAAGVGGSGTWAAAAVVGCCAALALAMLPAITLPTRLYRLVANWVGTPMTGWGAGFPVA